MSFLPNHLKPNSSEIKTGKTKIILPATSHFHPNTFPLQYICFMLKPVGKTWSDFDLRIKSKTAFQ